MRWVPLLMLAVAVFPAAGLRLSGHLYELGPGPDFAAVKETVVVEARRGQELAARDVASGGAYSLDLGPGDYHISALSPSGETRAAENVSLQADSSLDLILLPSLDLPVMSLNESDLGNLTLPPGGTERGFPWLAVLAGAGVAGGAGILLLRRRKGGPAPPPPVPGALPDDLQAMLRALEQEGGRMTQKELRRQMGHSEAKVSLMVADLESRGLVRKFKVGRGNIVVRESSPEPAPGPAGAPQSDVKQKEGS